MKDRKERRVRKCVAKGCGQPQLLGRPGFTSELSHTLLLSGSSAQVLSNHSIDLSYRLNCNLNTSVHKLTDGKLVPQPGPGSFQNNQKLLPVFLSCGNSVGGTNLISSFIISTLEDKNHNVNIFDKQQYPVFYCGERHIQIL